MQSSDLVAASENTSVTSRWRGALWPSWIDGNLRIILTARLAMSAARAIAGVVTALYLDAVGFSAFALGVLFLCVSIASALMSAGVGLLSDRLGRKPFLVTIPLLAAVSSGVFAVASARWLLFVFAALGSFGRGAGAGGGYVGPYQPAESAFVAESATATTRTAAFGRLAFFSSLGALAGSLLAGLARTHSQVGGAAATAAFRPAFVAAAVLAAVAGLVALGLTEERAPSSRGARSSRRPRWPSRSWPVLWRLWLTNGVNGLAIGLIGPFVSYWFYRRYGVGPVKIGLLFAVVNLGSLASTLAAAGIGRLLGTVRTIIAARVIGALTLVPMALAPTFWLAGAVFFVRMIIQRVGMPLRQSFTQELADPAERASVAALSNLPMQATSAGGQVLAGYLFQEVSLSGPFELAALFQFMNAALYGYFFGRSGMARSASRVAPDKGATTAGAAAPP